MKKLFLLFCLFFISCDAYEGSSQNFDVKKYKGFIIIDKFPDDWNNKDYYAFKNDSIIIKIVVPPSFQKYIQLVIL
jgi:hypothetical protein